MNWLFDSARQPGDSDVLFNESASTYYVVRFNERYRDEVKTVDVRHILIQVDEDGLDSEADDYDTQLQARKDEACKKTRTQTGAEDTLRRKRCSSRTTSGCFPWKMPSKCSSISTLTRSMVPFSRRISWGSVRARKYQGWRLSPEGAQQAVSSSSRRSSFGTGFS